MTVAKSKIQKAILIIGVISTTLGVWTIFQTPALVLSPLYLVLLYLLLTFIVALGLGFLIKKISKSDWHTLIFTSILMTIACLTFYIREFKPSYTIYIPGDYIGEVKLIVSKDMENEFNINKFGIGYINLKTFDRRFYPTIIKGNNDITEQIKSRNRRGYSPGTGNVLVEYISFNIPGEREGSGHLPSYLSNLKNELNKEYPENRTINLVFHGHSVPAGYFRTPNVNTIESYPFQLLRQLKEKYPYAVINVINTSIGGESSDMGQKRFETDVLNHKPDVLFIDYALNDRRIGLENSRKALEKMIIKAKHDGIKIILLTPSPDLEVNLLDPNNELEMHTNQIKDLSEKFNIGLVDSYSIFKQIKIDCDCVEEYMSQINHPNERGHALITAEMMKYFND